MDYEKKYKKLKAILNEIEEAFNAKMDAVDFCDEVARILRKSHV